MRVVRKFAIVVNWTLEGRPSVMRLRVDWALDEGSLMIEELWENCIEGDAEVDRIGLSAEAAGWERP